VSDTVAPLTHIPDILEEHLDELQILLARRPALTRSSTAHLRDLADLDARILAHLDGVLSVGDAALEPLAAMLTGDDPGAVRAATFAMLHLPPATAAARLRSAFDAATGQALVAIAYAMRLAPPANAAALALTRAGSDDPLADVVSARVLTHHGRARPRQGWLAERVRDPSPLVRQQAWILAGESGTALDPKSCAAAVRDPDPAARREGMLAAARCAVAGILNIIRHAAGKPTPDDADSLCLFAALCQRDDEKLLRDLAANATLGPLRFELIGLSGSPRVMDVLLEAMAGDDPRAAVAAGAAFRRMTGVDIESPNRTTLPPEDGSAPDEFEAEFQDEALLPDASKARDHWTTVEPSLAGAQRVCGGFNASSALSSAQLDTLDLDTRWWQLLRHGFHGWPPASSIETGRFPVEPRDA
jgi:hypothetical protein